jgi:hypothetical protein
MQEISSFSPVCKAGCIAAGQCYGTGGQFGCSALRNQIQTSHNPLFQNKIINSNITQDQTQHLINHTDSDVM